MALIKSLKNFFGLNKKQVSRKTHQYEPPTPTGNRALPRDMQYDVMMAAQAKRERKEEKRRHVKRTYS